MQQAENKGSSGDGIERVPRLDNFRLVGSRSFYPIGLMVDGSGANLYNINPGALLVEALTEVRYLAEVLGGLARTIADRVESEDMVTAQLAYAAMRMAEQASNLTHAAQFAEWVQP